MSSLSFTTIAAWDYRETDLASRTSAVIAEVPEAIEPPSMPCVSEEDVAQRLGAALDQAKQQWDAAAREQQHARDQKLMAVLQDFATQRAAYFREVEAEVVHLSLAIARKLLRREASVDPTLLCGLVRIALDTIRAEGTIRLRLPPGDLPAWKLSQAALLAPPSLHVVEDSSLGAGDAILESEAGKANIGFEAQFKQVEQGFLDLLAQRPEPA